MTVTFGIAISAVGTIKNFNINNSLLSIFNLLALVILFYFGFDPYYMLILSIFFSILSTLVNIYYANKYCGITYLIFFKEVFLPTSIVFIISFLFGLFPHLILKNPSFFRLALVMLTVFTTFIFSAFIFGFTKNEKFVFYTSIKSVIYNSFAMIKNKYEKN
jgi:hypothetical protein